MAYKEPMGVGGVITTYALTSQDLGVKALSRSQLEKALVEKYEVGRSRVESVIDLAFCCNVLREENGIIYVQGREEALGRNK